MVPVPLLRENVPDPGFVMTRFPFIPALRVMSATPMRTWLVTPRFPFASYGTTFVVSTLMDTAEVALYDPDTSPVPKVNA